MNERILELIEQSGLLKYTKIVVSEHEKLAELIIQECIICCKRVICDPVPKNVDTWLNGGLQCIDEIKQHFGVE